MRGRVSWMLAVIVWAIAGAAFAACEPPEMDTALSPLAGEAPVPVTIGVTVADVMGVSDEEQRIELDLLLRLDWEDPRLADLAGCKISADRLWFPPVQIGNSAQLVQRLAMFRDRAEVGEGGHVHYLQRLTGWVSTYHNLARFPFDSQQFRVQFLAPDLGPEDIVLMPGGSGLSKRLNIEGWKVHGVALDAEAREVAALGVTRSILTLTIAAERVPTYYLWRVLMPLGLVVAMSWVVFWVPPERFEFKMGLGATAMLTSIAFSLSVAGKLPTLGYLTVMDRMMIWSVLLVFLTMFETLVTGLMAQNDRAGRAHRIDRAARLVFPLALVAGWLWMVGI